MVAAETCFIDLSWCNGPPPVDAPGVLVLDLDGTIRVMPEAFDERTPEHQEVVPHVLERAWAYRRAGWIVCAATNQSGVGRGVRTHEEVRRTLNITNMLCGGLFYRMFYCPHADGEDGSPMCHCRKPRPGMLLSALAGQRRGIMVGDRPEDRAAAEAARIEFIPVTEFAPTSDEIPGVWPEVPMVLSGPSRFVWSAICKYSPHTTLARSMIRSATAPLGFGIPPDLDFITQTDLIAKAAWPVVFWASTSAAFTLAGWLSVAHALGAHVSASHYSLARLHTLRSCALSHGCTWLDLKERAEENTC